MGSKSGGKMEMRGSGGSSSASDAAVTATGTTFPSDSLNGLMFGKKIYFEDVGSSGGALGAAAGGSSSSASSSSNRKVMAMTLTSAAPPQQQPPEKKGKGVAQQQQQQQQPPRCQVEGCQVDLTGAKAYYCRHKVCGMHSKSPKVVVTGMEQRFCQQCSRFHQLREFDQGKRSCRRRLAGHNERRRKPPPGSLSPRFGRFPSFHEDGTGTRFRSFLMDFSSYPRSQFSSRDLWPTSRPNDSAANTGQLHESVNPHYTIVPPHQYPPPFTPYPSELPPGECYGGGSTDSSCALSLLSTQPWGGPTVASGNRAPSISGATSNFNGVPIGHQLVTNVSNSLEIHPNMGLRHFGDNHENNGQFSGELELALQGNGHYCPEHGSVRAYDRSGNCMHWSL